MNSKILILVLGVLLALGCGSGTYDDDAESWQKVFGESIPKEVEVIKSRFWKSAHWTYEFEFYCKLKTDRSFLKQYFIDHYQMTQLKENTSFYSDNKPDWFIRKFDGFEVWEKEYSMTLYINNETDIAYLHCIQF